VEDPGQQGASAEDILSRNFLGRAYLGGGYPRGADHDASDQGQWGAAFRYYWDRLQTELGLYYVRFHDKQPTVSYVGTGVGAYEMEYYTEFVEKVNLYGVSFNTTVGGVAIAGEGSFRPNMPTPITSAFPDMISRLDPLLGNESFARERGMVREKRIMGIVNALWVAGPGTRAMGSAIRAIRADDLSFIGEFAVVNYPDLDDDISYAPPAGVAPDIDQQITPPALGGRAVNEWRPNATSLGYQILVRATYSRLLDTAWALTPSVSFRHDAYGTTPDAGVQFTQGVMKVGLQLQADYQNRWKWIFSYTNSFGAGAANADNDRDFVQFSVSYAF
jgi:hypothetical protein